MKTPNKFKFHPFYNDMILENFTERGRINKRKSLKKRRNKSF